MSLALLMSVACGVALAAEGAPVRLLAAIYGEGAGEFNQPTALYCGERLTVADTAGKRLVFFDLAGEQFKYSGKFDAAGSLGAPFCVAELSGGKLLVAERGKPTLSLCDPKANSAAPLPLQGVPQGAGLVPGRFCLGEGGRLYLIDQAQPRIVVLSSGFAFEGEIRINDRAFTGFTDVRADRRGTLYALETLRGLVHVFDANLKPVRSFGAREGSGAPFEFPVSLATDRQGNVYVLDGHRSQVLVFDPEGRLQWRLGGPGWKAGSFNGPAYLALDGANRVFVADRLNNRVQVFAPLRPMD
jgi:sugar lactone lactonase YvrE